MPEHTDESADTRCEHGRPDHVRCSLCTGDPIIVAQPDAAPVERDLWWGYLCPALANIGALKQAQSDLVALGADWAEAGRILSRVQSFYVDAAHKAARRYVAEVVTPPGSSTGGEG